MKKLSEVCKIVGVTRRTLQEYDKVGLLHPTSKTEVGYWEYDNAAIQKLIIIQIFVEAGYKRKTIKALLESPTLNMFEEFDHMTDLLEEKRRRIDVMINMINRMKLYEKLPINALHALGRVDVARLYEGKSFISYLENFILQSENCIEGDSPEEKLYMLFFANILAAGCLMGTSEDSEQVQSVVEQIYENSIEILKAADDGDTFEDDWNEKDGIIFFSGVMYDTLNDSEVLQKVDHLCGEGATAFISRAVQVFVKNKKIV